MPSDQNMFGLDAELAAKQAEKYDPELEREVVQWLQTVTGETKEEAPTVCEWLSDGLILCAAVNKLIPGKIKKVSNMKAPFKKMENIKRFTDAARDLGVPEGSMFATPDLYEEKNMNSVILCIFTFGGVAQATLDPYPDFPKLGVPINVKTTDVRREKIMATQGGGLAGTLQTAAGFTSNRMISSDQRHGQSADAEGLDKDLAQKMQDKMDPVIQKEVIQWIEVVTGSMMGDKTFGDWLKSGEVLCDLGHKIKPGFITSVARNDGEWVNSGPQAFKQMENIGKFLKLARVCGQNESALFSTPDLFEEKNLGIVVTALYTFGGVVQANVPDFPGPHCGVAINSSVKDTSRGLGLVTDQNEAMQRHMEVERPKDPNNKN